MTYFQRLRKALSQPRDLALYLFEKIAPIVPDKAYLRIKYYLRMGRKLHLQSPKTFNEKLQWLKLYERKPDDKVLSDKYAVKQYITETLGEQYVIPLLGVWNHFDDIDFNSLPDRFVLKCTHDSGGLVICKDKSKLDLKKAKKIIERSLKYDYFIYSRENAYKDVPRRIIAEAYMEDITSGELVDYKVHNFNGEPKFILLCQNRFKDGGLCEDFYSAEWEHLDIKRPYHPNAPEVAEKPEELEEILRLSRILSKGRPFVRTDFYIINHRVYFGEITFSPACGMTSFVPEKWDTIFGEWIELSKY